MPPPTARRAALMAVLLTCVLTGCAEKHATAPQASPTPLANLNTDGMQVPRIDFCKLVPPSAVQAALGGKADDAAAYGNGDQGGLSGVAKDVLHEIGCVWEKQPGTTARAWVFARPVTPPFARSVIQTSSKVKGCKAVSGPAFGQPTYTQQCSLVGGEQRVRHAGLFGQTWLSCEVSAPSDTAIPGVRARTDAWCVEVANALNTTR